MKKNIDLNCDLGEHETPSVTAALMRFVSSANIACGGHAGDMKSMQRCLRLAKKYGVKAGAHPGLGDKNNFGRSEQTISSAELQVLLCSQISCLETIARREKAQLHHIKLHGALYQMVEKDAGLGKAYLDTVLTFWPKLAIRSIAGGRIEKMARLRGLPVSPELFADRAYLSPLVLLPRTQPGAVISDPAAVLARVKNLLLTGTWPFSDTKIFRPKAKTICIHGDTEGSVELLRKLRKLLH